MKTIESLNGWSASAGSWAISNLIGTALVLVLVGVIWLCIRGRSAAALGCWLFLLVLVKPLIPFQIAVPQSWLPFQKVAAPAIDPVVFSGPVAFEAVEVEPAVVPVPVSIPVEVSAPPALTWQSYLLIAWASVVASLLLRFAWQQSKVIRWRRDSPRLAVVESEVALLSTQIGLRRKVRVRSNPDLDTPMVSGLFRPSLMIPEGFDEKLDDEQRRWVLLHELAHVKRGDLWILAFQRLAQIVLFFTPPIWIANRMIDRLREYACDDVALVHSKIDRRSCGEGFLRLVEHAHAQPIPGAAALGLFERGSDSKRRLVRILDSRRKVAAGLGFGSVGILFVLGMVLLPGVRAQEAVVETASEEIRDQAKGTPKELDMVPEGNYLVSIEERNGEEKRLNLQVKDGEAECVNASSKESIGIKGKFTKVEPGVFKLIVSDGKHQGTVMWHMRADGSFDMKEIPDRGVKQLATPVKGEGLDYPAAESTEDMPEKIVVILKADGKIYEAGDDEKAIAQESLIKGLERAKALNPDVVVIISADKTVGHGRIVGLIKDVRKAGVGNISVSTTAVVPRTVIRETDLGAATPPGDGGSDVAGGLGIAEVDQSDSRSGQELRLPSSGAILSEMANTETHDIMTAPAVRARLSPAVSSSYPEPDSAVVVGFVEVEQSPLPTQLAPRLANAESVVSQVTIVDAPPGNAASAVRARPAPASRLSIFGKPKAAPAVVATVERVRPSSRSERYHALAIPVAGIVSEVLVKPGSVVKKGDVLLKLDDRQAEAALRVAEVRLMVAMEKSEAEAKIDAATLVAKGNLLKQLIKKAEAGMVPLQKVEELRLELEESQARNRNAVAESALEKAEFEQARSLLSQYQIVAPVDGTIEKVEAKLGEYVSPHNPAIILKPEAATGRSPGSSLNQPKVRRR